MPLSSRIDSSEITLLIGNLRACLLQNPFRDFLDDLHAGRTVGVYLTCSQLLCGFSHILLGRHTLEGATEGPNMQDLVQERLGRVQQTRASEKITRFNRALQAANTASGSYEMSLGRTMTGFPRGRGDCS